MKINHPTSIYAYLAPLGSHYDPIGKEGLALLTVEILNRGFYKDAKGDILNVFIELESLGASLTFASGYDNFVASVHAPKNTISSAVELLNTYLNSIIFVADDLEKAKKQVQAHYKLIKSESRDWAAHNYFSYALQERSKYGNDESLDTISKKDIEEIIADFKDNRCIIEINGSEDYKLTNSEIMKKIDRNYVDFNAKQRKSEIKYLGGEFKQKVVFTGRNLATDKVDAHNFIMDEIVGATLNDGLKGMAYEYIRRDNSAAYYAAGRIENSPRAKTIFLYAGTSEETIPLVLEQTDRIFNILKSGTIEEDRIEDAKTSRAGKLINLYDDLEAYLGYIVASLALDLPILSYKERKEAILNLSAKRLSEYVKSILTDDTTTTYIVGDVAQTTKDKLSQMLQSNE
jgi:predicted Zn-dependent peptidase